ncbi:MAG: GIY-YIG nuclease family protein [Phaeodactylibacter sp.]|nr:GIY-YIG nuclease family protein [Phaeodactylibacter sp.]MCB9052405.1 GIY-YIG nuclease family protein [Lewinellaceae bacterium]
MNRPQSILIFLPDGSPRSVKIAEITNRVVKAVFIPRNKLEYAGEREEAKSVGLYFLFGESSEKARPVVYIGEAEDCYTRLKQHNREKEFWNYAVVMVSKINAFTKAHVKYLEHLSVKMAKEANRYDTENGNIPAKSYLPEHMEADLLDSFDTIKILLSTLGFPIFESVAKQSVDKAEILELSAKDIKAEGDLIDDGFVVFKGSEARKDATPSCQEYLITLRNKLLKDGIIEELEDKLVFREDYIFNSPSTAGGVLLGRATNGWTSWRNGKGKTLDELKRK